jgi:hypothetical protein
MYSSARQKAKIINNNLVLEYGKYLNIFTFFSFAAAIVLPFLMRDQAVKGVHNTSVWEYIGAVSFFVALGAILYIYFNFSKIYLANEGFVCKSPWGKSRKVIWSEIKEIDFSPANGYVIRMRDKKHITINFMMSGVSEFVKIVQQKAGVSLTKTAATFLKNTQKARKFPDQNT